MWRFSKSTMSNMMKNICGEYFQRPFGTQFDFGDAFQTLRVWLISSVSLRDNKMQMPKPLNDLLKATSRSFYLTLRVLPAAVRPQIGLAYLLARTTDTIADTEILPVEQRLDALQKLRERILGQSSAPLNFGELAQSAGFAGGKIAAGKGRGQPGGVENFRPPIRNWSAMCSHHHERTGTGFAAVCAVGLAESRRDRSTIIALETAGGTGRLHLSRGRLRGRVLDENLPRPSVSRKPGWTTSNSSRTASGSAKACNW